MILYHATTPAKILRYQATGGILPPVRGWAFESSARTWAKRVGRSVILRIEVAQPHPLPDHQPRGHAYWADEIVRAWEALPTDLGPRAETLL